MQLKRKRGRPSEEHATDKATILSVALREFALKGYEGASMTSIAKAANTSDSLLYYYFKGKDILWREAIKVPIEKLNAVREETEALFKDLDEVSFLKVMVRQTVYFAAANLDLHKIMFLEINNRSERAKWVIKTLMQPMHETVQGKVLEAQRKGLMVKIPIPNLFSILIGASTTFFTHAYKMELLHGINPLEPDQIEQHADVLNQLIFGNLGKS